MFFNGSSLNPSHSQNTAQTTISYNHELTNGEKKTHWKLTWQGKFYLTMLCIMLLGAINYQNNLGILTVLTISYCIIISAYLTKRYIKNICIELLKIEPVHCGATLYIPITVYNDKQSSLSNLSVSINSSGECKLDTQMFSSLPQSIHFQTTERGFYNIDHVQISSSSILGAVKITRIIPADNHYYVYPKSINKTHITVSNKTGQESYNANNTDNLEYYGLKTYQRGDSHRRINWKAHAKGKGLYINEYKNNDDTITWINWSDFDHNDLEARLSHMTYAILDRENNNQNYGLSIPGLTLQPNHGSAHLHSCLEALASFNDSNYVA